MKKIFFFKGLLFAIVLTAGFIFVENVQMARAGVADLQIVTDSLPDATVGKAYSHQIEVTGGVAPYSWNMVDTTYPDGCCILGLNLQNGVFDTQTAPTVSSRHTGTFYWTFKVTDSNGVSVSKKLSLTILSDLEIVTTNLPDATVGKAYSTELKAIGGRAPYKWSPISTTYRAGCCVLGISNEGPIFNTQTSSTVYGPAGDYSWVLKVTDANGDTATKTIYLKIKDPTPVMPTSASVITSSLPSGRVNEYYSARIKVSSNGDYSPNFIISGLPQGLSMADPSSGYENAIYATAKKDSQGYYYFDINGIPKTNGLYSVVLRVFNTIHTLDFEKKFTLQVENPALSLPNLKSSTSFVNFYYTRGDKIPENQSFHLANSSNSGIVYYNISVPNHPDWLNTTYSKETLSLEPLGSAEVGVAVNPVGLSPGTYKTEISFIGNFLNSPVRVPITLVVKDGPVSFSDVVHPVGTLVNINGTVYKVTPEGLVGYRSPAVLYEEGHTFDDVVPAGTETSKLQLVGFAKYPDGTLINDNGTVYIIEKGKKRGFVSADSFLRMGFSFQHTINDDLSDYPLGGLISSIAQAHPIGTLVNDGGAVFLVSDNERVGIPSIAIFKSHGYDFDKVVLANDLDRGLPYKRNLKFADGTLINDGGTIFLISQEKKYGFSSAKAFLEMGYRFNQVINASTSDYSMEDIY